MSDVAPESRIVDDQDRSPSPEPAAVCAEGELYWRGAYRTRDELEAQRAEFAAVDRSDWFCGAAQSFIAEIDAALETYDALWGEEE